MSPRPGTLVAEQLRELQQEFAMLCAALEKAADHDQQQANLSKAAAAYAGTIRERLHKIVALLPRDPGRPPLEENPESFLQKVKMLHDELGWGRPRILDALRADGATDWQVRCALKKLAGEKSGSRRSRS